MAGIGEIVTAGLIKVGLREAPRPVMRPVEAAPIESPEQLLAAQRARESAPAAEAASGVNVSNPSRAVIDGVANRRDTTTAALCDIMSQGAPNTPSCPSARAPGAMR